MSEILLTGIIVLDIINKVDSYPAEDSEIRATYQEYRRGGNASNTATILSQLGHSCTLAATLADDQQGQFLLDNLVKNNISTHAISTLPDHTTPTSCITLSRQTGSRSIIHYRNLPELTFEQFNNIELADFDWFHFEGRNIEETKKMMKKTNTVSFNISLELEKNRDQIDSLIPFASIIFISRPFVISRHFENPHACLEFFSNQFPDKLFIITWGESGAYARRHNDTYNCPAYFCQNIIDTVGAGDTFIAGFISSQLNSKSIPDSLTIASRIAGLKCSQDGLEKLELSDVK